MIKRIKRIAAISVIALAATASMSVAQSWDPQYTGYHYTYYHDAEKTQYQGDTDDIGCGSVGSYTYVVRVNVPSPYYDATPSFYCGGGGMETGG